MTQTQDKEVFMNSYSTGPPIGANRTCKNEKKLFTYLATCPVAGLRSDEDIGIYANVMT